MTFPKFLQPGTTVDLSELAAMTRRAETAEQELAKFYKLLGVSSYAQAEALYLHMSALVTKIQLKLANIENGIMEENPPAQTLGGCNIS